MSRPPDDRQRELADVVHRNIRALIEVRRQFDRERRRVDRIADAITAFTGSMTFVAIHAFLFGGWIVWNSGLLASLPKFDPYPFVMLAMAASVEAIFLSTFVLISQNRQAAMNEKRAQLDLQINLLAEHEVTRLISLTERMAQKLGVEVDDRELEELKQDVAPERVLDEIERADEPR